MKQEKKEEEENVNEEKKDIPQLDIKAICAPLLNMLVIINTNSINTECIVLPTDGRSTWTRVTSR